MEPLCDGLWACMRTAAVAVRQGPLAFIMTAIPVFTAMVLVVDIVLAYYNQRRDGISVGETKEKKKKKKKKKKKGKKKNGKVGGGDVALREEVAEVVEEQTKSTGDGLVVKGGGFEQAVLIDDCLVVEDENRLQPVCSGDGLVVEVEDMDQKECSELAVKGGDLGGVDVEERESVSSDDSLAVQCGDLVTLEVVNGGDLNQPECSGHGLEVEKGDLLVQTDDGVVVKEEQGDDDWEGIERSDLEERFGRLVKFMDTEEGKALLVEVGGDLSLKLYGLRKMANDGPCYKSRMLFLSSASRARWNSWKSLGTMERERAMEQYIKLLCDSFSGLEEKVGQ